jgi:very-short-patch-repair endonuclease
MPSERIRFARSLRRQPTLAEDILWAQLRGSRFHGAKFKRQVPFDRTVVDFTCHAAKLVVEIDGKPHEQLSGYDEGRSEILERLALRVVRFGNEDVCNDIDSVFVCLRTALRLSFI